MREILFRGKRIDNGEWVEGYVFDDGFVDSKRMFVGGLVIMDYTGTADDRWDVGTAFYEVSPDTICQFTGLLDKNGNKIWENDILRGNNDDRDLVKVVFGEFGVIDVCSLEVIDNVIGWHYEVIPTDHLSRTEPFCLSMPLTSAYVKQCKYEVIGNVFDNAELLEE